MNTCKFDYTTFTKAVMDAIEVLGDMASCYTDCRHTHAMWPMMACLALVWYVRCVAAEAQITHDIEHAYPPQCN